MVEEKAEVVVLHPKKVRWDEHLDLFKTGSINLNFYQNKVGYYAGECVSGTIDVELKEPITAAKELQI